MSVVDGVKKIVVEQGGLHDEDVTLGSNFVDDLGFDSLGLAELIRAIEEEYSIDIPDEAAGILRTVNDLVDYVTNHTQAPK